MSDLKPIRCALCGALKNKANSYQESFIWVTMSDVDGSGGGFQTDTFNSCRLCAASLLFELREHIKKKLRYA